MMDLPPKTWIRSSNVEEPGVFVGKHWTAHDASYSFRRSKAAGTMGHKHLLFAVLIFLDGLLCGRSGDVSFLYLLAPALFILNDFFEKPMFTLSSFQWQGKNAKNAGGVAHPIVLPGELANEHDQRGALKKIDGNLFDDGYSVKGDPRWDSSQWTYEDENEEHERYGRRLTNPPCVDGRSDHEWDEQTRSRNSGFGWYDSECKHCGATKTWVGAKGYPKSIDYYLPSKIVYLLKNKKTGKITRAP